MGVKRLKKTGAKETMAMNEVEYLREESLITEETLQFPCDPNRQNEDWKSLSYPRNWADRHAEYRHEPHYKFRHSSFRAGYG
jgi:hypothetical protein